MRNHHPIKFVKKHRVAIAIGGTAAFMLKWQMNVAKIHNDFLQEHGLLEKFYDIHGRDLISK